MAGEGLIDVMRAAAAAEVARTAPMELLYGRVLSAAPMRIAVEGDERMVLDEAFLVLSALCKDGWTHAPKHVHGVPAHETDGGDGVARGETETAHDPVKLWRGLESGDRVRMLRANGGQVYYVLDREDGVLSDS